MNLQLGLWMRQLQSVLKAMGTTHSSLFSRWLNPPPNKLYKFENDFMTVLEKVQATTRFIGSEVDVRDDYGILRTLRRGVTSHARNMGVGDALLKIFNRWRTEMNSNGIATLDMIDTYSKLSTLVQTLLKFSRTQWMWKKQSLYISCQSGTGGDWRRHWHVSPDKFDTCHDDFLGNSLLRARAELLFCTLVLN